MESHLRRVDLMVGTIVYVSVNAEYRESAEDTCLSSLFDTFAYSRDVLFRDSTADNAGLKLEGFFAVRIHRSEVYLTVTVLTTTTRLFCILAVYIYSLCEGLFVSYLRSTYVSFNVELTKQTVYDNLQMELAHTSDDCLTSLFVCISTEGRILLCQFCKSLAHLVLTSFGLRLDSDVDNRLRELHGLQDYRMLLITDSITCGGELESDRCCDITGVNLFQLVTLVGMHLKDTSNTLFFVLCCIQYV